MIGALVDLLGTFYQSGDFGQVECVAKAILTAIPDDIVAMQFLGLACFRTGRVAEAEFLFDKAGRRARSRENAAPFAPGERAATQCLREATRFGSQLAAAWYEIGLVLAEFGRYRQAVVALKAALTSRPGFAEARRAMHRVALLLARRSHRSDGPVIAMGNAVR